MLPITPSIIVDDFVMFSVPYMSPVAVRLDAVMLGWCNSLREAMLEVAQERAGPDVVVRGWQMTQAGGNKVGHDPYYEEISPAAASIGLLSAACEHFMASVGISPPPRRLERL